MKNNQNDRYIAYNKNHLTYMRLASRLDGYFHKLVYDRRFYLTGEEVRANTSRGSDGHMWNVATVIRRNYVLSVLCKCKMQNQTGKCNEMISWRVYILFHRLCAFDWICWSNDVQVHVRINIRSWLICWLKSCSRCFCLFVID